MGAFRWKRLYDLSESDRHAAISSSAVAIWAYMVAHTDCAGRFTADPRLVIGKCMAQRDDVTIQSVADSIDELNRAGLIHVYGTGGKSYLVLHHAERYNPTRNLKYQSTYYPAPPPGICYCIGLKSASTVETTVPTVVETANSTSTSTSGSDQGIGIKRERGEIKSDPIDADPMLNAYADAYIKHHPTYQDQRGFVIRHLRGIIGPDIPANIRDKALADLDATKPWQVKDKILEGLKAKAKAEAERKEQARRRAGTAGYH